MEETRRFSCARKVATAVLPGRDTAGQDAEDQQASRFVGAPEGVVSKKKDLEALSETAMALMWSDIGASTNDIEQIVKAWQKKHGLKDDGWPGRKTMLALWNNNKPSVNEIVNVAIACTKYPDVAYKLGKGGFGWFEDEAIEACDCSGFVAICLGRSRNATGKGDLGGLEWVESTQLCNDGEGAQELVVDVGSAIPATCRPGDIVAYPDRNGRQGHVGIVVKVEKDRIITVDCSSSGDKSGSAIQMRDRTDLWRKKWARCLRPAWLVR